MEIVDLIYDLAIVLVFIGVAILPRAVVTYLALREQDPRCPASALSTRFRTSKTSTSISFGSNQRNRLKQSVLCTRTSTGLESALLALR